MFVRRTASLSQPVAHSLSLSPSPHLCCSDIISFPFAIVRLRDVRRTSNTQTFAKLMFNWKKVRTEPATANEHQQHRLKLSTYGTVAHRTDVCNIALHSQLGGRPQHAFSGRFWVSRLEAQLKVEGK